MPTPAQQILERELQRAVAARTTHASLVLPAKLEGAYRVSPEVAAYLQRMAEYRERAKTVRVGSY